MIAAHPPEVLNLVLVDFKGGATFLGLERAPHVAAVITNLADEAHLVARMKDALAGEMNRRQELLRAAGNFANVADYERARSNGAALAPLPALFVVVDEFSELLSQHPDFAELFVAIGRLGRSLGIHLLLASQRLDEGRLRGLESHLSYRICLKTFSANESRAVLGRGRRIPPAERARSGLPEDGVRRAAAISDRLRVRGVCRPRPVDDRIKPRPRGVHRRGDRPCHIGAARPRPDAIASPIARCWTPCWTDWPATAHRRIPGVVAAPGRVAHTGLLLAPGRTRIGP